MALIASGVSTSGTYVSTVLVGNASYSVPADHYVLLKSINHGPPSSQTLCSINGKTFYVGGSSAVLPSGGIRFPAGTVFSSGHDDDCTIMVEVYTE